MANGTLNQGSQRCCAKRVFCLFCWKAKVPFKAADWGQEVVFAFQDLVKLGVFIIYSYNFVKTDRPHRFVHVVEVKFIFKNLDDVYYVYIYTHINFRFYVQRNIISARRFQCFFHNGKQRSAWIHFLKRTFSAILHQGGLFRSHLMIILPFNTALTNIPPTNGKGHSPDFILGRVDMLVQLIFCNNLRLKKGCRCFFPLGLIAKNRDTCEMMNKQAICTGVLQ